jgi:hypothetical protein
MWSKDPSDRSTDTVRGNLALRTLQEAKDEGYYVVVERGICSQAFIEEVQKLGIDIVDQEKVDGKVLRRRSVMNAAHLKTGIEVICWLEAEKLSYIHDGGLRSAVEILLSDDADIVVPKRKQDAFDTYPSYQGTSEQRGNKTYNGILRNHRLLTPEDPDMEFFFGPIVYRNREEIHALFRAAYTFRPKGTSKLHQAVKPENNNSTLLFPVVDALIQHFRVRTQEVPYVHPQEQTENEEGDPAFDRKRDEQLSDILIGLVYFLRLRGGDRTSRLQLDEEN